MHRTDSWRRLAAVVSLGVTLAGSAVARATPNFPDVVASKLNLASPPACALCHAGNPGAGTATTPFAVTLQSRGARAYDEASLELALDAIAAEGKDSDGDGIPDVDELKAGGDPNAADGESTISPEYGCSSAGSLPEGSPVVAVALGIVALVFPRRRADWRRVCHARGASRSVRH